RALFTPDDGSGTVISGAPTGDTRTPLEKFLDASCGINPFSQGCLLLFVYNVVFTFSAFLLWLAALSFNAIVAISLSSQLFIASDFVSEAWAIVRDLSNIFFILILLYVAIQMILGLGGHGGKKMIAQVIVMALLINFSMFFTKVVIDTSNILALVFYNKLEVETKVNGSKETYMGSSANPKERDLTGAMMKAFDPTQMMTEGFIERTKESRVLGRVSVNDVPFGIMFGIIVLSGIVMGFAAYAFFVSGFAFLNRIIELWILIIFSPFALMSSTLPILSGVPYVGWKGWFDRLLAVSFMAPIFMFFIYLIFKMIETNIFTGFVKEGDQSFIGRLLLILVPAMVILIMLLMATKYAKKASGQLGDMVASGAKIVAGAAGLGLGVGALGLAAGGRLVGGSVATKLANHEGASGKDALHYGKALSKYNSEMDNWKKNGGVKPTLAGHIQTYQATHNAANPNSQINLNNVGWRAKLGGRINASQLRQDEIGHARHDLDEARKKAGLEGVDPARYSAAQKEHLQNTFIKSNESELERDIKRGHDSKNRDVIDPRTGEKVQSEANFKKERYDELREEMVTGNLEENLRSGKVELDAQQNPQLTRDGQKMIENQIGTEFNNNLRNLARIIGEKKFGTLEHESKERVSYTERAMAKSTGGSYDLRNIVEALKADKGARWYEKGGMGLVGAVALGVRAGLKNGIGVNAGTPQKDVWKDLGNVLTESLKNMKINIKIPEASKHDDSKAGHGTGGGGGHH
ncbi:MAG: hypothetical protein WD991_01190, partial [Candidatus Paceibacterota bacterium]